MRRFLLVPLLLFAVGCASTRPMRNERSGLFDPPSRKASAKSRQITSTRAAKALRGTQLAWPLKKTKVTSAFGLRSGDFHEGVDLRAIYGTPVYASHDGKVLYSDDRIRGYGKMIVLKNSRGFSTIYAHNSRLLVRSGQVVKRGQRIAISGKTGRADGPHLHFEVRTGTVPVNPMQFLPSKRPSPKRKIAKAKRVKKKPRRLAAAK